MLLNVSVDLLATAMQHTRLNLLRALLILQCAMLRLGQQVSQNIHASYCVSRPASYSHAQISHTRLNLLRDLPILQCAMLRLGQQVRLQVCTGYPKRVDPALL